MEQKDFSRSLRKSLCHLEVISFAFGSSVGNQYHLDVSGRTRGVFNGASRFADSVWIGVHSATDVGHLAFEDVVDASKFGLVRASFWSVTVVDSFASSERTNSH